MKELILSQRSIQSANNQSHFDAGDVINRRAQEVYKSFSNTFNGKYTEAQQEYLDKRADEWHSLCDKSFNDELHRRASFVPVNVCGPANYPSAKMHKIQEGMMNASQEWERKRSEFIKNTHKELGRLLPAVDTVELYRTGECNDIIYADDPSAADKLCARIEYLRHQHAEMKAQNAKARKEGGQQLPWYELPYALREIKRLEGRLTSIRNTVAKATESASAYEPCAGVEVIENTDIMRLQLVFEGKPSEEIRHILKSRGFIWSGRNMAWQRQLTDNARYAAKRAIEEIRKVR